MNLKNHPQIATIAKAALELAVKDGNRESELLIELMRHGGLAQETIEAGIRLVMSGKRYHVPHGYFRPEKMAAVIGVELCEYMRMAIPGQDPESKFFDTWEIIQSAILASQLTEHDSPIFWLGRDLGEALLLTDYPEDLCPEELVFPYPTVWFQIPEGLIIAPNGYPIQSVLVSRFTSDYLPFAEMHRDLNLRNVSVAGNGILVIAATAGGPWLIPPDNVASATETAWRVIIPDDHGTTIRKTYGKACSRYDHYPAGTSKEELEADEAFNWSMVQFASKILLYLMSRDRPLPKPVLKRREKKNKKGKVLKSELWGPNFIGEEISIAGISGGTNTKDSEPGSSKRAHWVRGHYRRQAHGKGRKLRKTVFIAPYRTGEAEEK